MIGPMRAKATLRAITQRGTSSGILSIARQYRADRMYNLLRLHTKFASDIICADKKFLRSKVTSQIYSHKCGFNTSYHLYRANSKYVGNSLNSFIHEYGIPNHQTYDYATVQVESNTRFQDTIRRNNIKTHIFGLRRPNENPAEGSIFEIKNRWYRVQSKKNAPNRLYHYDITWLCEAGNIITTSPKYANGRTPLEIITGLTLNITENLDFDFYDWVTF